MSKPKIVVVGSSNTDMVVRSAELPRPGETRLGGEFLVAAGGKGANQAVAAARAGGLVTFVACVGDDVFGRAAPAAFRRERIDTRFVRVVRGAASGVALIMVDARGENLISVASGANSLLSPADVDRAEKAIAAADCLVVQLETPLSAVKRALELARRHGVLTLLNPAPAQTLPRGILRLVDVLTPNRTEMQRLTTATDLRKGAERLRKAGVGAVVLTLGGEGAIVFDGKETRVGAFKVKAVDAVAAGDCFTGALAVALAEGKPLADAVRFASGAAAISVTRHGAQPSLPRRGEIDVFLAGNRRK